MVSYQQSTKSQKTNDLILRKLSDGQTRRDGQGQTDKSYLIGCYLTIKCWLSKGTHKLSKCSDFKSKSLVEKRKFVQKETLCWNCFAKGHVRSRFRSRFYNQ